MTASAAAQRRLIRQYKYPSEDEARAKILYYREARDRIEAFHRRGRDADWLRSQASNLRGLALLSSVRTRTRLRHNARALIDYGRNFSTKTFSVLPDISLSVQYGDLRITAFPDLYVNEDGESKIIKLDFSKKPLPSDVPKIICQVFLEASIQAGMSIQAKNILLFDVTRGKEYKQARIGARMSRNIEATCQTISAVWDTI